MSNELIPVETQPLEVRVRHVEDTLASRMGVTREQLAGLVLANCLPKDATDGDKLLAYHVIARHNLDAMLRELHFLKDRNGRLIPFLGYDGWIQKAHESPSFASGPFIRRVEKDGDWGMEAAFMQKGAPEMVRMTAWYKEWNVQTNPNWKTRPEWMLTIRAVGKCARLAFGLSGIYDEDEARQMSPPEPREAPEQAPDAPDAPSREERDAALLLKEFEAGYKAQFGTSKGMFDFMADASGLPKDELQGMKGGDFSLDLVTVFRDALAEKKARQSEDGL